MKLTTQAWEPELYSYVEDLSGCIGQVTGLGALKYTVRVKFGKNCYRDLLVKNLKPAKYSSEQLEKIRAAAPELLKAAQSIYFIAEKCNNAMLPSHTQELLKYIETELANAIKKATE